VLFSDSAPLDWLGWPGMQDLGTHWIAGYHQREGHNVLGTGGGLRMRFSDDEGATWTAPGKFLDGSDVTGLTAGVGSCYFLNAPNGDVLFLWNEASTGYLERVYRSSDGGHSWTSAASGIANPELRMQAGYGFTEGSVIYVPFHKFAGQPNNATPWGMEVWASADDGVTWALVGEVDPALNGDEFSIMHTEGTEMIALVRDRNNAQTFLYRSPDMGVTWGAQQVLTEMGVVQMGRMRKFDGFDGIVMFGRLGSMSAGAVNTVVYYMPPDWSNFVRRFIPDSAGFSDGGYCDVLRRADGTFYWMSYGGTTAVSNIRGGVFEIA
jgi:hypothetical protein